MFFAAMLPIAMFSTSRFFTAMESSGELSTSLWSTGMEVRESELRGTPRIPGPAAVTFW